VEIPSLARGVSANELTARNETSGAESQDVAFAQQRTSAATAPVTGDGTPGARRDPLAVYGASGRMIDEPAQAGISILA
jgi:hypothetical protein